MQLRLIILLMILITSGCSKKPSCDVFVIQYSKDKSLFNAIQNITDADGFVYQSKDDKQNTLDCIKIIPYQNDTFLGVYHSLNEAKEFEVHLSISTNLIDWKYQATLGVNASQPTIQIFNEKIYVLWEQEPNNHLLLNVYENLSSIVEKSSQKSISLSRKLSNYAEGTPNFYSITDTLISIGFHYYKDGDVDRIALGELLNFNEWNVNDDKKVNESFLSYCINGNIGDRDFITFNKKSYIILEAQKIKNDFSSWRIFLYDIEQSISIPIDIKTHFGSKAFANPTVTIAQFKGKKTLIVSFFIPHEGAEENENGSLIYYKYLEEL